MSNGTPIAAVLIHVPDWKAGIDWYAKAFPQAIRVPVNEFGCLRYRGISIEIVAADEKVSAGQAGSVVYWTVDSFEEDLKRLLLIGGRLYRGPLKIEHGQKMCQVLDPWGNCVGLRGPAFSGSGPIKNIEEFWLEFCENRGFFDALPETTVFGDSQEQQNQLCNLVLMGRKCATASLAIWYGDGSEPKPRPGDLSIILDGEGIPRGIIETTDMREGPFNSATKEFAAHEGEGDGSLEYWTTEHRRYFTSELAKDGLEFFETIQVIFEKFKLVW